MYKKAKFTKFIGFIAFILAVILLIFMIKYNWDVPAAVNALLSYF